jgi:hypothetical protein
MMSLSKAGLWSISSTFFACNFRTKFWRQKFQTQNTAFVQNFGAKNALWYKKRARKTLMKLTPGQRPARGPHTARQAP